MVKADVRRDYYGDLGLTPSADSEDIKRQFRKLALKYHPDRNPGKEVEFNAKFQAIQAAHEILIDPQQRLKYDTDRLRNGYFGPSKPHPARKETTNSYSAPKPAPTKTQFSERPKSFHNGPSSGAQRYASYARAAPKQPWEKTRDETQTRADAYRGFQEMKGNPIPGWTSFDPRTGRSGQPGTAPRPSANPAGHSARPRSAFEYFKTFAKPPNTESAHTQSARKKQGFTPHAAGGDEPMAAKTSSYRSAYRSEREYTAAPSPTSRKPTTGFQNPTENLNATEFERTSSKYASTGGEKTFFSSSWLGRSSSLRSSPKSPKSAMPRPRTNPPSPTPQETGRHRSASPNLKSRNYSSTSSSDLDDDDEDEEPQFVPKPKAVPKSRLRNEKYTNSHMPNGWTAGFAPDSDSAASSSGKYASDNPTFFKRNGDVFDAAHKSNIRSHHQNPAFRSCSHDDLRKPFASTQKDHFSEAQNPSGRGRTSTRNSPHRASDPTAQKESSRSESASQQMPFVEESYLANDWGEAFKFKNMSEALPNNEIPQRQGHLANSQRTRSPRKTTRPATRVRPAPKPASVATEAEEAAKTTYEGRSEQESTGMADADGEAMDLDDEPPTSSTTTADSVKRATYRRRAATAIPRQGSKPRPKDEAATLNLKILGGVPPLTSTNNGGIEDLKDIYATLPFESRAPAPRANAREVRFRELSCPNPPKRPEPPQPVTISAGSQKLGYPRAVWDRYIAEMNTYMREWNTFHRRMLSHFLARQSVCENDMAPNWIGAVGDAARVKVNGVKDVNVDADAKGGDICDESDDSLVGTAKAGFDSYARWLEEDERVHKHWDVARERHKECIEKHKAARDWALSGGKIF